MNPKYDMRQWIDLFEVRRGLAPLGEMRTKVFWQPRKSDLLAMLSRSKLGDLRGSLIEVEAETLMAIWPARNLGHWNFHNECSMREGIWSTEIIDMRICTDLSVLTDERYWSQSQHYAGDGFYCAFHCASGDIDPNSVKEIVALMGPLTPISGIEEPLEEQVIDGTHLVYHASDWGNEIIDENLLKGKTTCVIRGKKYRGFSTTRSFRFAKQFQDLVLGLNFSKLKARYRVEPFADSTIGISNTYGDARREAEEFVIADSIILSDYLEGIWINEDSFKARPEEFGDLYLHEKFKGFFKTV